MTFVKSELIKDIIIIFGQHIHLINSEEIKLKTGKSIPILVERGELQQARGKRV